jgi:CheY-like chemotaxis protein
LDDPRCTVLVVEDEWLLRIDLVDAVEAAGMTALEAGDVDEALEHIRTAPAIDILVTDIRLNEDRDGWDIAEAFRQRHPRGDVIYASANPPRSERQLAGSLFFEKPVSMRVLGDACRHFCSLRRT